MLTNFDIEKITPDESIELAILLWDHAYASATEAPLTEEQKKELDRRLDYDEAHPGNTVPWEEFMKKYSL
ncbi:MAG: addiction module protein [Candidatus Kapaibacterium sp.]